MKIGIILGTTRQGRAGERVAKWVYQTAQQQLSGHEVTLLDLKDYDLPFFTEPISPQFNPDRKSSGVIKEWLDTLAAQDAFIVVTPEYNRSIPAVLKNAIDYVAYELARKPVAIVSYGTSGGHQALSHLRGITAGALAVSIPAFTSLIGVSDILDESGKLTEKAAEGAWGPAGTLSRMLSELEWYAAALSAARS